MERAPAARGLCLGAAALFAAFALGCAGGPQARDESSVEAAPAVEDPPPDLTAEDRVALAGLTTLLGGPLPEPADDDPVGVEEPGFEATRVYAPHAPTLAGARTRLRATAWRDRVHTLELTFPEGCPPDCVARLEQSLVRWVGPLRVVEQGRARLHSLQVDTVRVRFEAFPRRSELTRLLLSCQPLADRSAGRPASLPEVGEPAELDPRPPCRALPP